MCVAKYQFKSVLSLTCILKKGVLLSESCILWRKTRKFRIYVNLLDELITPQEFIPEYIEVVIFCCEVLLGYFKSLDKLHKKLLIIQHFLFFSVFQQAKQIQDWLQPSITPPSGHLVNRKESIGTTPLAKDWLSNLGSTKTKYVCPVMTPISSEDVQRYHLNQQELFRWGSV